jgi:hypothetical protein
MRLTPKQVEEVRAPSTKYPAEVYADELARIIKGGRPRVASTRSSRASSPRMSRTC